MKKCCSFVILNYNSAELSIKLSQQVARYSCVDAVVIIDNCSTDNSISLLRKAENSKIHIFKTKENKGYGVGNNYGVKISQETFHSDICIIANPDITIEEKSILELIDCFRYNRDCAAATGLQIINGKFAQRTVWPVPSKSYCILHGLIFAGSMLDKAIDKTIQNKRNQNIRFAQYDCLAGSLLAVNTKRFLEVEGFDETFFLYMEESVLGFRLKKAGYKSYLCTRAEYVHQHSATISTLFSVVAQRRLLWESTEHYLKSYCACNAVEVFFSKVFFNIGTIELVLMKKIKTIFK